MPENLKSSHSLAIDPLGSSTKLFFVYINILLFIFDKKKTTTKKRNRFHENVNVHIKSVFNARKALRYVLRLKNVARLSKQIGPLFCFFEICLLIPGICTRY